MSEFNPPNLELGRYRHYKGNEYEVLGVGCHTETLEYFVVYRAVEQKPGTPEMWLRPYDMFIETIEKDGKVIPRFEKI
jgi:cyclomaltodextrinase / maltogenic alpha-amylase / neopullulanase